MSNVVVTPGYNFPDGTVVDNVALRRASKPTVTVSGVGTSDITDESVTNSKLARNNIDLSQRALDLSLSTDKIAAGAVTAAKAKAAAFWYADSTLSAGVYGFTLVSGTNPAAYAKGQLFLFKADVANTGATNVNVNSLGSVDLFKPDGSELNAGDIVAGQLVLIQHDGTQFRVLSALNLPTYKWVKFVGNTKTSGVVFTVNTSTNVATATAHGMSTSAAQALTVITSTTLPAPLSYLTTYYTKAIDADTFKFYPTAADALAGTNEIDITTAGTGTQTLYYVPITRSVGVSSVIRTPGASATTAPTAGDYTIQFTNAFPYAGYVIGVTIKANTGNYPLWRVPNAETPSASSKRITVGELTSGSSTIAAADVAEVHFRAESE